MPWLGGPDLLPTREVEHLLLALFQNNLLNKFVCFVSLFGVFFSIFSHVGSEMYRVQMDGKWLQKRNAKTKLPSCHPMRQLTFLSVSHALYYLQQYMKKHIYDCIFINIY